MTLIIKSVYNVKRATFMTHSRKYALNAAIMFSDAVSVIKR